MKIDYEEAKRRLRQIMPMGLTAETEGREPGKMSLENAICFATGEPPGEEPSCVAELDLEYSTILSSAGWSSDLVRGEALLPLVIAQLGTTDTDRETWADQLVLGTVKRVLPLALDAVDMTDHAQACRSVET